MKERKNNHSHKVGKRNYNKGKPKIIGNLVCEPVNEIFGFPDKKKIDSKKILKK